MKHLSWIIVVSILSLLLVASAGWNYLQYQNHQEILKRIVSLEQGIRQLQTENTILKAKLIQPIPEISEVVFTFDDGPYRYYNQRQGIEHTEIILDILKAYHIKATFFVLGSQFDEQSAGRGETLERYRKLLKRMVQEGHTVGIHDHYHIPYTRQSRKQLERSLVFTANKIKEITGRAASVYVRSPGGRISQEVESYLKEKGYRHTYWHIEAEPLDLKSGEYLPHTRDEIAKGRRGIILMHDRNASDYLSDLIKYLSSRNIKIIPLAEWESKYGLPLTPYQNHQTR